MLKVMTLVGTRPELIKMSRVIATFDQYTDHILVHTGQNFDYELNQIFFDELSIRKPDYFLAAAADNAVKTIARVIEKTDDLLAEVRPEAFLVYGDTNSCMAVIAAKRRKIPIFHMEAGNRCFDQRVPEELNRKVIDHLSDINLVLTEHARRYLMAEGIKPDRIIKTGSHMQEVLQHFMPNIQQSTILNKLKIKERGYFLVSIHREENVDDVNNLSNLLNILQQIAQQYNKPVIISTHPRTQKRLEELGNQHSCELIHFLKPFGFLDYIKLQMSSFCILSDSGTITEEASLLNLPAITLRNAHERPEGMDEGILIMSRINQEEIIRAINIVTSQRDHHPLAAALCSRVADYNGGLVADKILKIVTSYTAYINQVVWSK
jgi:UDP-N-acetylglucosamine 2-epimerase